ncbi:MAG: hypothetical protein OIF40_17165 [Mangrovicoccus sp.]|nr:hypothetical protein [Mangrovicoccus sp.]
MAGRWRHWPLIAALFCAVLIWQPIFTANAARYNDEVLSSAIRVYAVLRGINAVLSVAKETEVGVQLVGTVTTQPAMILDPVDETVARVSDAVFALAAASGVLKIAFAPMAQLGAGIALLGFVLLYLPVLGIRGLPAGFGRGLALFGLILSLALPLGYGPGGRLGHFWTESAREEAQAQLDGSAHEITAAVSEAQQQVERQKGGEADPKDASSIAGILDRLRDTRDAAGQAVSDAVPEIADVQQRGGEIFEASLTLVAIFVFRLIVLPLILLWALGILARRILA